MEPFFPVFRLVAYYVAVESYSGISSCIWNYYIKSLRTINRVLINSAQKLLLPKQLNWFIMQVEKQKWKKAVSLKYCAERVKR
jgi:hypothetical protein